MAISTSAWQTPSQNRLLAALPAADFARLQPHLELVSLPLGWAVYEAGGTQGYVYFPINAIVSLLYVMEDGSSAEIAVSGNEGLVGISLFMGGETTPSRAVVQSAGHADGADGGVQPSPRARAAALPLAAAEPRPPAGERAGDDPGADRQHAGRAPRGR